MANCTRMSPSCIEQRPQGTEGDNLVKTRLATGDMNDIFFYNSGSLLQALHPADTLVDLSEEPFIANIAESFLPTVSRAAASTASRPARPWAAGSSTTRRSSTANGLKVPTTWAEFEANNEALKAAGVAPVGRRYRDSLDVPAVRARGLLQRAGGRPRLRRAVHGQQAQDADDAGRAGGLPAPPGGLRQGLVAAGLRLGDLR